MEPVAQLTSSHQSEVKLAMSTYTSALFVHVSGAIGVFAGIIIWLFGLSTLRRARRVEQVRAIAWLIIVTIPFMVLSLVLLGIAGLYMALSTWGLQTPWIIVSLVSLVLFAPINIFVLDPRMRILYAKAGEAPGGPVLGTVVQTLACQLHRRDGRRVYPRRGLGPAVLAARQVGKAPAYQWK